MDLIIENTNKSPSKKKLSVNRMNTCAKFGILECSCCTGLIKPNEAGNNKTIVHEESNSIKTENTQLNLPSTSASTDIHSYIDSLTADINFDELDELMKKYDENFLKVTSGKPSVVEEEEIDVVNDFPELSELREVSTIISTVQISEITKFEESLFVNETVNEDTPLFEFLRTNPALEEEIDVVTVNEVDESLEQKPPQNIEEEIDVGMEIDENAPLSAFLPRPEEEIDENAPLSSFLTSVPQTRTITRKRKKLHRNPAVEDEIVDVVNLTDEATNVSTLSTVLVNSNKNLVKKRKSQRHVMNIINKDSIIEITDSPIAPRIIPEVINIDDDDENIESSPKGPSLGTCPVCMEEFVKCEIMSTMCGHVFCGMCIKTVIKTTKKCPKCRKHLTLKSIHPLFI